jgi:hypothetical protein
VTIQAVTLQCVQLSAAGQTLTQNQTVLNGPAQPGQIITFPAFSIGAEAQGVTKVNCGIVAVKMANQ